MSTDKLAIIAVTERGRDLAITLTKTVAATIFVPEKHCTEQTNSLTPDFGTAMREIFTKYQALICIMATGIAVRTLAPVIEDKLSDPAVLVMDEHGKFIISLLSGHVGGANELTERIATITGGAAVITTATDRANVAAIDNIAKQLNGYLPDFKTTIKRINGLLAAGKEVGLHIDEPLEIDTRGFTTEEISPQIYISTKYKLPMTTLERIQLVPKQFILGVGCRKGISAETIDA
ncbi:cobalt-precorrin 5A hydrolase, partial [Listeria monocytogenes]|nr:cobalt-precorrin 5A hydrolase [Listeria monocytogenes]